MKTHVWNARRRSIMSLSAPAQWEMAQPYALNASDSILLRRTKMIHRHVLIKHLRHSSITKAQAYAMYGIWNTGGEIHKLRQRGYNIETKMIPRIDGSPYACYSLKPDA